MRGHRVGFVLGIALLAPGWAWSGEKVSPEQISICIRSLGSDKFPVRERAARELLDIGAPALKSLQEASRSSDVEVRQRSLAIMRIIDARILNETLIRAPKISLKFDKTPLDAALADVCKKTGLPLALVPNGVKDLKKPLSIDTGEVPFWEAVEKFLDAAGLVDFHANNSNPNANQPLGPQNGRLQGLYRSSVPAMQPGAVPMQLVEGSQTSKASSGKIIRVRALPKDFPGIGATKGSNDINLGFDITPAPSLAWRGLVSIEIRRAVDDRGVVLVQSHINNDTMAMGDASGLGFMNLNVNGNVMVFQGGGRVFVNQMVQWDVSGTPWDLPNQFNARHGFAKLLGKESSSKVLRELDGIVTAQILTPVQPIMTVDNVLAASLKESHVCDSYRLQIVERKAESGQIRLRFKVVMPAGQQIVNFPVQLRGRVQAIQIDNGPAMMEGPQVSLQDHNGKTVANVHLSVIEQSNDGFILTTEYLAIFPPSNGKGEEGIFKLVLSGRRNASIDVPFRLNNVVLP